MTRNALSPDYVLNGLIQRGLPEHIAQGFVMNMRDESGLNPGINEAAPVVAGSRGGFGLSQWTGPRRRQLEAYAAQKGRAVSDPDMQMDFLLSELHGSERGAWQTIQKARTAGEAGAAIVNRFLRPAEAHRARREAAYLGGAVPAGGGSYGPPSGSRNALAADPGPMQMIDPVALLEATQRQVPQMGQTAQQPVYDARPTRNALADYAPPQFDTTAYNSRRLRG